MKPLPIPDENSITICERSQTRCILALPMTIRLYPEKLEFRHPDVTNADKMA